MKLIQSLVLVLFVGLVAVSCKNDKTAKTAEAKVEKIVAVSGEEYKVATSSRVLWKGSHPGGVGAHNGDITVSEGAIVVKEGKVAGGNFTIDMTTINDLDLEGGKKAALEAHLKGTGEEKEKVDHFFNVNKFPTAKFEISKVAGLEGNADANALVYGNLTVKGITKSISFPANIAVTANDVKVTSPEFAINRTDFGIKFMSGSFTDGLADKAINDELLLNLNVTATK